MSLKENLKTSQNTSHTEQEDRGRVDEMGAILHDATDDDDRVPSFGNQAKMVVEPNIIILHDANLTSLKTDLFIRCKPVTKSVPCAHLADALTYLKSSQDSAKIVVVHTGSSEIASCSVDAMYNAVTEIHALVSNAGMKLVFSTISEDHSDPIVVDKARSFNKRVKQLNAYDSVVICQMSGDVERGNYTCT